MRDGISAHRADGGRAKRGCRCRDRGGAQYATLQYRAAQTKLDLARDAIRAGDYDRARMLAEDAEADARLAAAQARSRQAQRAADEVRAGIRALEDALAREAH